MNNDRLISRHSFVFNDRDNGGESLSLKTDMYTNGDDEGQAGIYLNQELTLQSYCNSATISLVGAVLTPTKLRELANQLESELIKAGSLNHPDPIICQAGNVATNKSVCSSCGK